MQSGISQSKNAARSCMLAVFLCLSLGSEEPRAQTYTVVRIDGRPSGVLHDSGEFDPILDAQTFADVGIVGHAANNINGPSVIRLPAWLPAAERINPAANYYLYFAHHNGDSIRLAWSEGIASQWKLFNDGKAESRSWGSRGQNSGPQTPGDGVLDLNLATFGNGGADNDDRLEIGSGYAVGRHVASPEVLVDNFNHRFIMYFHGPNVGIGPKGQQTFVATSANGLNFNMPSEGGQAGHGVRDVVLGRSYFRTFQVADNTFAYANMGALYRAPATNDKGQPNTIANGDSKGGFWKPSDGANPSEDWWDEIAEQDNPIQRLYTHLGKDPQDPRHFAFYSRTHLDPADTNLYAFYSARNTMPESILLSVIDTNHGSRKPAEWTARGQDVVLQPELEWEGADLPLALSHNGSATNVRQLRDPCVFEDTQGTAETDDDRLYLFYTGEGEEAIGVAELTFAATAEEPLSEPLSR